jgi:hypothetical protein
MNLKRDIMLHLVEAKIVVMFDWWIERSGSCHKDKEKDVEEISLFGLQADESYL